MIRPPRSGMAQRKELAIISNVCCVRSIGSDSHHHADGAVFRQMLDRDEVYPCPHEPRGKNLPKVSIDNLKLFV